MKYNNEKPSSYNNYTDLALERRRADVEIDGIEFERVRTECGVWERVAVRSEEGARAIGRPMGIYDTLSFGRIDLIDCDGIEDAKNEIAEELCKIFEESNIFPGRILVVGLGNPRLTPDSLGCESAARVKPTLHISELDRESFLELDCSELAVCTPGVTASSGMDASVTVRGICEVIAPNAVIAIDSICARSEERLGRTVQISNTGVIPGSGLGNTRSPIDSDTLGIPVIAIGVPTVIDSRYLAGDGVKRSEPMFVSPKEINEIIEVCAEIISGGINRAFGIYV